MMQKLKRVLPVAAAALLSLSTPALYARTVYYDNSVTRWETPHAYCWTGDGSDWPGNPMSKVEDYTDLWKYDTDEAKIIFNNGVSGDNGRQTDDLTVSAFEVYRMDEDAKQGKGTPFTSLQEWIDNRDGGDEGGGDEGGDSGGGDEGDGDIVYTDRYWLEPAQPSVDQQVVVHFYAAEGTTFRDTNDDLYFYGGLACSEEEGWRYAKWNDWDDRQDVYKMTRDSGNRNHFTYTISPSLAEYFNLPESEYSITHLAFIVRNYNGDKADGSDQYLPIVRRQMAAANPLGDYLSYEFGKNPDGDECLVVTSEKGHLYITPYAENVAKVLAVRSDFEMPERKSISVCAGPADLSMTTVLDDEERIVVKMGRTLYVSVFKSGSKVAFSEKTYDKDAFKLRERDGASNRSGECSISFEPMGEAAFYGGGYFGDRTNQDGRRLTMDNVQTGGWSAEHSISNNGAHNICIPFIVSTGGYGLLFDDHYRGATIEPSSVNGTVYRSGSLNPVAYYYVGGTGMQNVVENYTLLTGRQQLPPFWALGYHTSRYGYKSLSEAEQAVDKIIGCGIPVDGVVFDLYWQGVQNQMGTLRWNESGGFADASGWLARMKSDKKVHTTIITEPFFANGSTTYKNYLDGRGFLADTDVSGMDWLDGNVGLIDVTNPDALFWFTEQYDRLTSDGVDGHWMDLGEPEKHDDDSHHAGGTVQQVHNEFGNIWVEGVYNMLREKHPDMRPFLMPRAGTSGMQRFSTFPWTGDIEHSWSGLQAQVPALVSAAMSGVSFLGSDVGGFTDGNGNDANLYLRWIESATFAPMMRTHAYAGNGLLPEPYHDVYGGVRADVKKFINLRYQYLPYTYTLAWFNTSKGTPMARPVNMYDSNPGDLADVKDEYLWGRDILVAPVLDDKTSRTVRFPDGKWMDLNDYDHIYSGGEAVQYHAPLGTLPYFGRLGSFIPRYAQEEFSNTASITSDEYIIDYLVDPERQYAEGYLYEDDRDTPSDNPDHRYLLTCFYGNQTQDELRIAIMKEDPDDTTQLAPAHSGYDGKPDSHKFMIVVHNWDGMQTLQRVNRRSAPSGTETSDESPAAMTQHTSLEMLQQSPDNGYYLDKASNRVYIKASLATEEHHQIVLNSNGAVTGLEQLLEGSAMTLSYAGGYVSYSLDETLCGGRIEVYDASGVGVASFAAEEADGMVHQASVDLLPGIYVIRLSASTEDGIRPERHIKAVVR